MLISEFIKILEIWIEKFGDHELNFTSDDGDYEINIEKLMNILEKPLKD